MRILVFQHLAVEHPGIFRDLWTSKGDQWDAVEFDAGEPIPDLDGYDLLVVMGGPMDVWQEREHPWLVAEKAAIRRWVRELERPYLGICLGHQLLASVLGGEVAPMIRPEVGLGVVELTPEGLRDPLLDGAGRELQTFQWHSAEIVRMPTGGVVLAGNEACAVQAMRVGRHAYGLQFHCEITKTTVTEWKDVPAYAASLDKALGSAAANLAQEVHERLLGFNETASRLDANLASIVGALQRLSSYRTRLVRAKSSTASPLPLITARRT